MFLCRSCLTGPEGVWFGALELNVLVVWEATMIFVKYSQVGFAGTKKEKKLSLNFPEIGSALCPMPSPHFEGGPRFDQNRSIS